MTVHDHTQALSNYNIYVTVIIRSHDQDRYSIAIAMRMHWRSMRIRDPRCREHEEFENRNEICMHEY